MKVLVAEKMPNGDQHFVIEVTPAVGEEGAEDHVPAVTEEFTWGADVPLETAKREMKLLLTAKYENEPTPIKGMVGKSL